MSTQHSPTGLHKLSELGALRTGYQLRGAAKHDPEGTATLVQLGDLRDDTIDLDRAICIDLNKVRDADILKPGCVLLRGRGATYGAALVPDNLPYPTIAAAPLVVWRPDDEASHYSLWTPDVLPAYLVWYINRPAAQAFLASQAHGTHVPTVGVEAFANLEIVVPPLAEQAQIVATADLMREERKLTLRLLEQRERQVQTLLDNSLKKFTHNKDGKREG